MLRIITVIDDSILADKRGDFVLDFHIASNKSLSILILALQYTLVNIKILSHVMMGKHISWEHKSRIGGL